MAPDRRRRLVATMTLALLVAVAACSSPDTPPDPADPTPKASTATPVEDLPRGEQPILPESALPDHWKRVPAEDRLEGNPGKPVYCGVEVEPAETSEGSVAYYEAPDLPRSVVQFSMVATEETATQSLDALRATRESCTDPGYEVEPVAADTFDGIGDQHVAWDFTAEEDSSVRFRALVFRRGEVVITLVATGTTSTPTEQQIAIARAIDKRLLKGA